MQVYNSGMFVRENYFDYAATTPVHPDVLTAMTPYFSEIFGNPSSAHAWGQAGFGAVEDARRRLAAWFRTESENIIFTGSSTEANNMVLHGLVMRYWNQAHVPGHVLISRMEHSAVRQTAEMLERSGFCSLDMLPIDSDGVVDPQDVARMLRPDTVVVSVIYGNNEIGTINPVAEIGAVCAERGVPFHSDATQFAAHNRLELRLLPVDFISVAAHKCYGPKGIGALIKKTAAPVPPLIHGGRQENAERAGTHNVPFIVGMAETYHLLETDFERRIPVESEMRERLIQQILDSVPDSRLTGHRTKRLSNHASFAFKNIDALSLQSILDQKGFAVSIGSACRSKSVKGQQQLRDIGLDDHWSNGGLRLSVGMYTTAEAVDALVKAIAESVAFLRKSGL